MAAIEPKARRARLAAVVTVLCSGLSPASFASYDVTLESLLQETTDLLRLTHRARPSYVAREASSTSSASVATAAPGWFSNIDYANESNGGFVRIELNEGRTEYVMLDVDGPGAITHIWSANAVGVLRVYIDGATEPAIAEPMALLLSGGVQPFAPLAHVALGYGRNLYFPLPYSVHCKVTVDSDGPLFVNGVYYQIHYRTYAAGTMVEPFSLAAAQALQPAIQNAAQILANPGSAYQPSPAHEHVSGTLMANAGPLFVSAPGSKQGGVLRELRLHSSRTDAESLRKTLLTIGFDGQETVRVPLGDFFGTGPGPNAYNSLPFRVEYDGTLTCRWPMPFQQSFWIEVQSLLSAPPVVSYDLTIEPYAWTASSLYFHASWRADHQAYFRPDRDWNTITIDGSGHYVGNSLNVANPFITAMDWWGEGDEKIWVDGEAFPSHFGTGTEDYYGYAWATCVNFQQAYHNQTRCDGPANYGHASVNRFHVLDAIPFEQSLRFDLEQLWIASNSERAVLFDIVNYWYAHPSQHNHPPLQLQDLTLPPLPPRQERVVPGLVVEGEQMPQLLLSAGSSNPQSMGAHEYQGRAWSRQAQRIWYAFDIGDALELRLDVAQANRYCIHAYLTRASDYGVAQLYVNGQPASTPIDLWNPDAVLPGTAFRLGEFDLVAGQNSLRAEIVGVNPASSCPACKYVGLDALSLIPSTAAITLRLSATQLTWGPPGGAMSYDIVRGDLGLLRVSGGDFQQATAECLAQDHPGTEQPHLADPAPGQGFWFLVRGTHCVQGSYGTAAGNGEPSACD